MTTLVALIIGYISIVFSDHMIHRCIMHGKWKIVRLDHPFFKMWLYSHYIQHLKVHHVHSVMRKEELSQGAYVPIEDKKKFESQYQDEYWSHRALICSDHGISIVDHVCLFSFVSLFLLTPHYFVSLTIGYILGPWTGIMLASMVLLPAINHYFHRFYHMEIEARKKHAPYFLRWYFLSEEVDRIAKEHMQHHHTQLGKDDYYNLLPLGAIILRPVLNKN